MASYIALINWTEEGIKSFGNSLGRAEATASACGQGRRHIKQIYWTLGAYDLVSMSGGGGR